MEAIRRWKRRHWMQQIDCCGIDGGGVAADAIDVGSDVNGYVRIKSGGSNVGGVVATKEGSGSDSCR